MKIKLPFVLRKTYEKEVCELVKDVTVTECAKNAAESKVRKLKSELQIAKDHASIKDNKQSQEIEKLKLELEERDKKVQGMEWCIQERDKELEEVRDLNFKMYKKIEMASEMQRQVRDKIDTAFMIDFITKKITPKGARRIIKQEDIKKLMTGEDLVEIYTKIGMML